ncbi:hypothetical protein B0H16DRAFT_1459238 [Mycena metata]|uniref:Uncharacterized protein n=1 Tax=Mycena metata TaxID=1033252 RepID=A0AAD7IZT8_9AGAR|nr:hypothetical protein B0H16DRAFT_1459238 [Mycena metata]
MAAQRTETSQHLADLNVEDASVVECGLGRKSWRICVPNPADGMADEVVFAVQGIICQSNLVPTSVHHMDSRKALRLTQHLEITGFGTGVFAEAMTKLEAAQDIFAQHFCGLPVARLNTPIGRTGRVLGASNRLFTLKVDSPTEQGSEFQPGMDPLGALERLTSEELIHGPENIVRYYKRSRDRASGSVLTYLKQRSLQPSDSTASYDTSFPGIFRPGDVAEMHASLIAIQTGDKKIKVTCRLHAVTLLDNSFTKVWTHAERVRKRLIWAMFQAATMDRIMQKSCSSRAVSTVEIRRRSVFQIYAASGSGKRITGNPKPSADRRERE